MKPSILFTTFTLLGSALSLPWLHRKPPVKYGPPTREQRLNEGWIDEDAKYFHEPGTTHTLGHYDARFFHGVVSYEERTDTLNHMIRAYLAFFKEKGLETWIAHGTLLGWWWNGKVLPWDWDIDTQVSGDTLAYMGKHFNQTRHVFNGTSESDANEPAREYLLDVNSQAWERVRGDGMNIIDARWIDTRNGLYIDITGLSEVEPVKAPGVVSCKNRHNYKLSDLFPMRETTFEGVTTMVPYAYDKLLVEEYNAKALTLTEYEGHRWDSTSQLWLKKPEENEAPAPPTNQKRKRQL